MHANCRVSVNGVDITREGTLESGFVLFAHAAHDLRAAFPDVRWELYDELAGEDPGRQKLAVRFVSTIDGAPQESEIAGFGVAEEGRLIEWHRIVDLETYIWRRTHAGETAVGG